MPSLFENNGDPTLSDVGDKVVQVLSHYEGEEVGILLIVTRMRDGKLTSTTNIDQYAELLEFLVQQHRDGAYDEVVDTVDRETVQ